MIAIRPGIEICRTALTPRHHSLGILRCHTKEKDIPHVHPILHLIIPEALQANFFVISIYSLEKLQKLYIKVKKRAQLRQL